MNPGLKHLPLPAAEEVEQISALSDPVIRNLQITQCYHELSSVLARRTGESANWCTYATWASKQAGQTIRKQDLIRALENAHNTRPAAQMAADQVATSVQRMGAKQGTAEVRESLWEAFNPAAAVEHASEAVGRGNKKVFEEIGREFARFLSTCLQDTAPDPHKITRFCDELRPGDPPDGQRYLRQAFTHYYESFFETNAKGRSELLLLANIEIGFHEQTRLQPEILEAVSAPFIDATQFQRHLILVLFPSSSWLALSRLLLGRLLGRPTVFEAAVRLFLSAAQLQTQRLITEHLMQINLPHGLQLRLGEDLSLEFPASLKQITNPELFALLQRIDPTPDSLLETRAFDWANLPDRLHFIIDMFRCFQESPDLFEAPFAPAQVAALKAGRLPAGQL